MEYFKDFDGWNRKKKEINEKVDRLIFNEGEVWWSSVGVNIDIEIDGKNYWFERPVLIVKKINNESALVAPLTTTTKDNAYIYPLKSLPSCVSLSQLRTISHKRLWRKVVTISEDEYEQIIIRLKYILSYKNETPPNRNN